MDDDERTLDERTLDGTRDIDDALPIVSRNVWESDGREGPAPIISLRELCQWVRMCPYEAFNDSTVRLNMAGEKAGTRMLVAGDNGRPKAVLAVWEWLTLGADEHNLEMLCAATMHGNEAIAEGDWLRWPGAWEALVPLVRAWQIAQATKVATFRPVKKASLPALHRLTEAEAQEAMTMPLPFREEPQLTMPGIEPVMGYPSWLLSAFEALVGEKINGRTSYELRLFVAALLRLPVEQRDGQFHTLTFSVLDEYREDYGATESIESLLFENGWENRERDWNKLPAALHTLNRSPATWLHKKGMSFVFFFVSAIPHNETKAVQIMLRVPRSAAHGDRIDWQALRSYGLKSRALYCAYLSSAALLGRTANKGHPQTAEIGRVLMHEESGEPKRGKGGRLIRSKDELVPNERGKRLVRAYTSADLARFAAMDPAIRKYRNRAVEHFERLHEDGHIDLRSEGNLWRIFGARR